MTLLADVQMDLVRRGPRTEDLHLVINAWTLECRYDDEVCNFFHVYILIPGED